MRITSRQLRRIIREEARRLHEDTIDHELDNLKKNIGDDIEHIRDLKDDIKDDHEEEIRAEKEKERKDESVLRRRIRRSVRRLVREEWGGGEHEYKRDDGHKTGDIDGHYKDYEGPWGGDEGDHSKTDPGHLDYEGSHEDDVHHKAKKAVAAIQDLASAAGVDIEMEVDDEDLEPEGADEALEVTSESRLRRRRMLRKIVRENTRPTRRMKRNRRR